MTHATIVSTLLVAALAAGASPAAAQSSDDPIEAGFFSVYGGAQPQRRDLAATASQTIYEETATITSAQRIRNGAVVQVGGGVRVRKALAVGARFSMFGRPGTGAITASIPDPIFFGRPKTVVADANDLDHRELGVHVNAAWFAPVSGKLDIVLSGGPSIIHVSQDVASAGVVSGTQNVTVIKVSESGNAVGFNAGLDALYRLAPRYGLGLFLHYVTATVDLPSASDVKVGGPQVGLTFQARF